MVSVQALHSFRLPAHARGVIAVNTREDLTKLEISEPFWILGEGTNTIFTEDYLGTVLSVRLRGIVRTETPDAWRLEVAAGENWHDLVVFTLAQGMPGFENLALIPGSVGAAPVQNIGAYGVEISDFIEHVEVFNLKTKSFSTLTPAECQFAYRESFFKRPESAHLLITRVTFLLPKAWKPVLTYPDLRSLSHEATPTEIMERVIAVRQAKLPDPALIPNAGSFFKNPVVTMDHIHMLQKEYPEIPVYPVSETHGKIAAGWLIDRIGLKGFSFGGAGVHDRQALVLVNRNGATGDDLCGLAQHIVEMVHSRYGVMLEPEVRLLEKDKLLNSKEWLHRGT
ncbi:UDP-N-acetylmuramate dehydrogenase [Aliidiomarina sanyensis]|uniref:UDP-N-acetylenolpyruvoylglucosamine reductase n=1 Tax=Aliidiomarina sanyensis TaxID=1249555 RepID=A0A432WAQ4_9GAMM|nr:UDP-N-acetylmuramate dehydrogenase [Aliidiomarina sanyensis]RUO27453.1 UDP-N-acetylenolpyruvoylglucosamine reductase [Aliidiomarina sanyensis]